MTSNRKNEIEKILEDKFYFARKPDLYAVYRTKDNKGISKIHFEPITKSNIKDINSSYTRVIVNMHEILVPSSRKDIYDHVENTASLISLTNNTEQTSESLLELIDSIFDKKIEEYKGTDGKLSTQNQTPLMSIEENTMKNKIASHLEGLPDSFFDIIKNSNELKFFTYHSPIKYNYGMSNTLGSFSSPYLPNNQNTPSIKLFDYREKSTFDHELTHYVGSLIGHIIEKKPHGYNKTSSFLNAYIPFENSEFFKKSGVEKHVSGYYHKHQYSSETVALLGEGYLGAYAKNKMARESGGDMINIPKMMKDNFGPIYDTFKDSFIDKVGNITAKDIRKFEQPDSKLTEFIKRFDFNNNLGWGKG